MNSKVYRPPVTISREEFLLNGSDAGFRRSIYALIQCVGRLLACRDAFGRELDLTPSQFAVLMGVAHTQGTDGVTIRVLSEHVALASTHVTTEVGRLERAGFLTKRPSRTDGRSVRVSLLPHAETEIARVTPFIKVVNDVLFRGIDAQALGVAHQVARQLILNSETALAEIRRRHLETAALSPTFVDDGAATSHAAKGPKRAAPRSADPYEADGNGRRRKAGAQPRSG